MTVFAGGDPDIYFGLMSGTSLDSVDGVAVQFERRKPPRVLAESYVRFDARLRESLLALQTPAENEIDREARAAHPLAEYYARAIRELRARRACARAGARSWRARPDDPALSGAEIYTAKQCARASRCIDRDRYRGGFPQPRYRRGRSGRAARARFSRYVFQRA